MKMSDVFKQNLADDLNEGHQFWYLTGDEVKYAVHSIDNHDALVELLGEFRDFAVRQGWQHVLIDKANKILEEEK